MAEYITRNNAISAACFGCNHTFSDEPCEPDECEIRQAIMALPTANVVEVVRCKDCKYYKLSHLACIHPNFNGWINVDGYCSYGVMKE